MRRRFGGLVVPEDSLVSVVNRWVCVSESLWSRSSGSVRLLNR